MRGRHRRSGERARGPAWRRATLLILGLLAVGACDTRTTWQKAKGQKYFDESGRYGYAGISTRMHADIRSLNAARIQEDTTARPFRLYVMRCGACHDPPDPAMKTGEHWSFQIPLMREKSVNAGLIPMTEPEADTILGFLRRHAQR